jgi:Ca2+-transporting ATPase
MLVRILGVGLMFFFLLAGLWQLLWHTDPDPNSVKDLITPDSLKLFVAGFADMSHIKEHLSGYELGIFFSVFVMLQFWNLFNAKYYRTDRSLLLDLVDLIRDRKKVKQSYSPGFIWIALVIVLGQILIVSFAGRMFNVAPLHPTDWLWIMAITSPVLIVADVFRTLRILIKK